MTTPHISVIIPVYNAESTLLDQLEAVRAAQLDAPSSEIIIVDNRSTDQSISLARRWAEQHPEGNLRIVEANGRSGEPHARNVGLSAARGELVAFCDADDRVGAGWLAGLCRALTTTLYATGPIDTSRLNPSWIANVRGTSVTGRSLMYNLVPFAHGCNMGFHRNVLHAMGGFDERYLAGCDLDIALRFFNADFEMGYDEAALVHYRLRPSLKSTFEQGHFYGRYRIPIRNRISNTHRDHARINATYQRRRRSAWLLKHAIAAAVSKRTRARWVWVLGQLYGEWRGERDPYTIDLTAVEHDGSPDSGDFAEWDIEL